MKKYQYFLQSDNKTAEGFGDSPLECKDKARKQLLGEKYNIKDITICECVETLRGEK